MQDLAQLIVEIIVISASGAMSPGPLTMAVLSCGAREGWKSGLYAAIGHTAVELPFVVLLMVGLASAIQNPVVQAGLGLAGGVFLMYMAAGQVLEAKRLWKTREIKPSGEKRGGFLVGVMLTGLNPFFLLWWATVGAKLIADTIECLGALATAVAVMYPAHVWLDYVWMTFIAYVGSRGARLKPRVLAAMLLFFAGALAFYGVKFVVTSVGIIL